jgi:hypothetical protein
LPLARRSSKRVPGAGSPARTGHADLDGTVHTYNGAAQGIESLLFDEGRSLLLCGAEKHFRVLPLVEDEIGFADCGLLLSADGRRPSPAHHETENPFDALLF